MLYLLYNFKDIFSPLNVLNYITFRAGGAVITALLLNWFLAPEFINFIRSRLITQTIRSDGPKSHLTKSNTPTMGGMLILLTTIVSTLLWARLDNRFVVLSLIAVVFLGMIGFVDDYWKWKGWGGKTKGISPAAKMFSQLVLSLGIVTYLTMCPPNSAYSTLLHIPYTKELYINIGSGYIILMILVIIGSSNAVNLTDGLDGLAIGSIIVSALTYSIFAYMAGHAKFSTYLKIIPVPGAGELTVFLAAVVGAALGFLWYNCYPAEIFMGDTGSLFLGGLLGLVAILIRQELILIIVGGLFVAEAG